MKKGFITEQELLARWPTIDEGELLEIIQNSVPVRAEYFRDEFYAKHGEYKFFAWHPLAYRPIKITEYVSNPPVITADVPFEVNGIKELYPHISKCLFSMEQVEKVEIIFPDLRKDKGYEGSSPQGDDGPLEIEQESVADYIQRRRAEGAKDEIIAVELHDGEKFKLTYLELARGLGLGADMKHISLTALKQRGMRLYQKGAATLLKKT